MKELWQMTKAEWFVVRGKQYDANISPSKSGKRLSRITKFGRNPDVRQIAENMQRDSIRLALSSGKPVPPEVLKDYPDLQPKKPTVVESIYGEKRLAEIREANRKQIRQMFVGATLSKETHMGKRVWIDKEGKKFAVAGEYPELEPKITFSENAAIHAYYDSHPKKDKLRTKRCAKKHTRCTNTTVGGLR